MEVARVRSFLVVVPEPGSDGLAGLGPVLEVVQVDTLVLERAPEALDEDVVHPPALAVHRYPYRGLFEYLGEVLAGELAPLVGIEDLRPAVLGQSLRQDLRTESLSSVFDRRQDSTVRVAQSMIATRYWNPRCIGM